MRNLFDDPLTIIVAIVAGIITNIIWLIIKRGFKYSLFLISEYKSLLLRCVRDYIFIEEYRLLVEEELKDSRFRILFSTLVFLLFFGPLNNSEIESSPNIPEWVTYLFAALVGGLAGPNYAKYWKYRKIVLQGTKVMIAGRKQSNAQEEEKKQEVLDDKPTMD